MPYNWMVPAPHHPAHGIVGEPEQSVLYRVNCVVYTSGTPVYRISATGAAAVAWAVSSAV